MKKYKKNQESVKREHIISASQSVPKESLLNASNFEIYDLFGESRKVSEGNMRTDQWVPKYDEMSLRFHNYAKINWDIKMWKRFSEVIKGKKSRILLKWFGIKIGTNVFDLL